MKYKATIIIPLMFFFVVSLSGCDIQPFEAVQTKNGNTLILNKITGGTHRITNRGMLELNEISTASQKKATQPRTMRTLDLPDSNINVGLKFRYLEGKLLYIVDLSKKSDGKKGNKETITKWNDVIEKNKKEYKNKLTIELTDDYGFTILELPVSLSSMTRIIGLSGEVNSYSHQGKKSISYPVYQIIENWNIGWNFDYKNNVTKK